MTPRAYRLEVARCEARAHLARARAVLATMRLTRDPQELDVLARMAKLKLALRETDAPISPRVDSREAAGPVSTGATVAGSERWRAPCREAKDLSAWAGSPAQRGALMESE